MDNADHLDASSMRELAHRVLGDRANGYVVVAFDYFVGSPSRKGGSNYTSLTLYLADADSWDVDSVLASSDPVNVVRYSVENSPTADEFFRAYSKRFTMRLEHRALDSNGRRLMLAGDLNELTDIEPEDFGT